MLSHTTPRNKTYQYEYDGNSNFKKETDPMGGIVQYTYNAFDEVTSFKDARNNTTSYSLDKLNRLTSETDAANGSDDYTYNAIGLLTQYTNKREQNITYSYDRDGRKTGRTTVEGATAYTYDPNGNLLTVTDSSGTITRTYDSLNRVTSYTNANDQTIGYEYDAFGNLKKLTYPDNKQVSYTYNANNQMIKVKDWNNRETTYAYDNNGRLASIARPDGSVETYTYNAAGQLTLTEDKNANNEIINRYQYSYDADGNIINEVSANEPNVDEISVDDAAMSYSEANRLTNFNGTPIPYDADGNMLKTPLGSEFGNLTFDSLNQLTDVTISGSAISYSYTYDAEGYRTSKTENGITTNFVVDPNAELSRVLMSTTGNETTYYVYGMGLISQEKGADYRLYHYDYRGSTTALTTLGGAVVDTMFYDAYGNMVKRTGADDTPFLYVGKYGVETDANGLYYMRARYYNPQIQRFINVDPIRNGYNWYVYAYNNSVSYIDPNGLKVTFHSKSDENMRGQFLYKLGWLIGRKVQDNSSGYLEIIESQKYNDVLFRHSESAYKIISQVINDPDFECSICLSSNGSNKYEDGTIYLNLNTDLNFYVLDYNGSSVQESENVDTELNIIFSSISHEFIHAYYASLGVDFNDNYAFYSHKIINTSWEISEDSWTKASVKELLTSGVISAKDLLDNRNGSIRTELKESGFFVDEKTMKIMFKYDGKITEMISENTIRREIGATYRDTY